MFFHPRLMSLAGCADDISSTSQTRDGSAWSRRVRRTPTARRLSCSTHVVKRDVPLRKRSCLKVLILEASTTSQPSISSASPPGERSAPPDLTWLRETRSGVRPRGAAQRGVSDRRKGAPARTCTASRRPSDLAAAAVAVERGDDGPGPVGRTRCQARVATRTLVREGMPQPVAQPPRRVAPGEPLGP